MNAERTVSKAPTEIEKCPYYDPVTRQQVKPGKQCPEYVTAKGCPYAHPWEYEKWDGEVGLPTSGFVSKEPQPLLPPAVLDPTQTTGVATSARTETTSEHMEVDETPSQLATALDRAITQKPRVVTEGSNTLNFSFPPQDPLEISPGQLQTEAVASLLSHIVGALHQTHVQERASKSMSNLKSLYQAYGEGEVEGLKGMVSPFTQSAWVNERNGMSEKKEDAVNARWAWVDALSSMEGQAKTAPLRITDGEDVAMEGVDIPASELIPTEAEVQVLDALNEHRSRLDRGAVGVRLDALQTRLGTISEHIQRRTLIEGETTGPSANMDVDPDAEMKHTTETQDTKALLEIVTADVKRLEDLLTLSENMSSPIDEADSWGTMDLSDETFRSELRAAVNTITEDFIVHAQDGAATAATTETSTSTRRGKTQKKLGKLHASVEALADIHNTSETLMRILGTPPIFDADLLTILPVFSESLSSISARSEEDVKSTLGKVAKRAALYSTLHDSNCAEVLQRTTAAHRAMLETRSEIEHAFKPAPLVADLPPKKNVRGHQTAIWFSEFEELKEIAVKRITPLVERTNAQEARLMDYGAGQRGTTGAGVLRGDGGLVSTQVSVEGAMG